MQNQLELSPQLSQQINQFQIQSLDILMLDNYELEQFLQNEFIENPLLDHKSEDIPPTFQGVSGGYREAVEIEQKVGEEVDKRSYFLEQINREAFSEDELFVLEYMIESMDESGYLPISEEEVSQQMGIDVEVCIACRKVLLGLEPAGVFARDLKECLCIQLERKGMLDGLLQDMILYHLDDISCGNIASIRRALSCSTAQVRKNIQRIKSLTPRPFMEAGKSEMEYIIPDLILEKQETTWKIVLNDNWIGDYSINDYYVKMMKSTTDSELKEYFYKKYQRCQFILNSIMQRRDTMVKIANAIVDKQTEYFLNCGKLKPMNMQVIADEIDMNVSTVSRAIKGKYMQYPYGTVSLRSLFSASQSFGNQDKTTEDIKDEIKRIIASENHTCPYSDQKISEMLKEKGMKISRRTVAKYREAMEIKGMFDRKVVT